MKKTKVLGGYFWTFCMILFVICMALFPKEVFDAAKMGMVTWWEMVFSALLPFFIGSELLMGFGVVNFMGVLLEPVMRPLFNVPGAGSFVIAVGYTSGFPIGSIVTAKLRKEKQCTRAEAERLVSFTNNSSPLFMLAAVAVGMFHDPRLGLVIACSHYLANLTLGFFLRFYGRQGDRSMPEIKVSGNLIARAFKELSKAQEANQRPLGQILGTAVKDSVNRLLVIGGFVILFAVFIKILNILGILTIFITVVGKGLSALGFDPNVGAALANGLLEMTIGTKTASEVSAPLIQQVMAASFILGWSGLCIHAQVAAMLSDTDIRMTPFVITRFFHGLVAAFYTYLCMGPFKTVFYSVSTPVFNHLTEQHVFSSWWANLEYSGLVFGLTLLISIALSLLVALLKGLRIIWVRFS